MAKFKTAEQFNALSQEEQLDIARAIVGEGWSVDASDYVDPGVLQDELIRIEKLAYAIGDVINDNRDLLEEELEKDVDDILQSFMSEIAGWTNQEYGGEYRDHDDGFWVSSNC